MVKTADGTRIFMAVKSAEMWGNFVAAYRLLVNDLPSV
jgi:hypothetical protein